MKRHTFLILMLSAIIVYGISAYKRYDVYKTWQKYKNYYFIDNITAMTTLDAYYWLKMARDFDNGKLGKDLIDPLKEYPDGAKYPEKPNLLVYLISLTHKATGLDYYRSGLLLIPILAGLFCIPLFFYFYKIGYGEAAIFGGLLGNFSYAYYVRSTMGRVDTDLLNIFFPILISLFLLLIRRENRYIKNIIYSVLAGISMTLFIWWYQKPGFLFVYIFFFVFYLLAQKVKLRDLVLFSAIFLLFAGPLNVINGFGNILGFLQSYFFPKPTGQIVWPDIMQTITESQKRGVIETLKMIHEVWPLVIIGFLGLLYLYVIRFKEMLVISPVIILGLLSLVGSNRFAMYLVPFIGVGVGVVVCEIVRYLFKFLKLKSVYAEALNISLMFGIFFISLNNTAYSVVLPPSIEPDVTKSFLELKHKLPKNSAMFTWWDYGYALMDIGEFATYHDGGAHGGLRSTLVATGLARADQKDLYNLISYLEKYKFQRLQKAIIDDNISADEMLSEVFNYNEGFSGKDVYILYTKDMIGKFGAISVFGTWDYEKKKSSPMGYNILSCSKMEKNTLYCSDSKIDLNSGVMQVGPQRLPLKRILFVNNGYVQEEREFFSNGYTIQMLMKDNAIFSIQLLNEELFKTNFNQQFILGRYDKNYFEEVYNNFLTARVFKVLKKREDQN